MKFSNLEHHWPGQFETLPIQSFSLSSLQSQASDLHLSLFREGSGKDKGETLKNWLFMKITTAATITTTNLTQKLFSTESYYWKITYLAWLIFFPCHPIL